MPQTVPAWLAVFAADQTVICASRTSVMQRITDVLARDYTHWVQTEVPKEKVVQVIEKFQARYPMLAKTRTVASKAKAKGQARHKAVVFWNGSAGHALIYLFTDRPTDEHREKWLPTFGTKNRVSYYQFEAVRHDREGSLSWTWRIESQHFEELRAFMVAAIRKTPDEKLLIFIKETRTWPGFHQVRAQHKALGEVLKAQWKRSSRKDPLPVWPRLYYLQRIRTR